MIDKEKTFVISSFLSNLAAILDNLGDKMRYKKIKED